VTWPFLTVIRQSPFAGMRAAHKSEPTPLGCGRRLPSGLAHRRHDCSNHALARCCVSCPVPASVQPPKHAWRTFPAVDPLSTTALVSAETAVRTRSKQCFGNRAEHGHTAVLHHFVHQLLAAERLLKVC
jgi:hypothetical protein